MSVHCRKRALKQRNSRPQPPQRAFAALARSLIAAAFVASFTVQALAQMSGGGHADHHPGTGAPANPMTPSGTPPAGGPGTQPSMGSGAGGMGAAGGMGEMMKGGGMGEMMGRPRKEFYPSLMDMPTLSAEQRQCIEAQARARISKGADEIQSAQDALRHANAAGDTASAEQAASRLRDGLDQVKSSTTTPETPTELREEQSRLGTLRSAYDRTTIALAQRARLEDLAAAEVGAPALQGATVLQLVEGIADLEYAIGSREVIKKIFTRWIVAHVVAAILMYFLLALHIAGEIYYGLRWLA